MEAVPTAVFITRDPGSETITGNRAARELVELPLSANLSKSALEKERPMGWQEMRNGVPVAAQDLPLQRAARGQEVRDYEMDLVFQDGTVKSVVGNATPLRDADGNPQGGIAVLMDVTARKLAEERVLRLNEDLEERARDLDVANEELERLATSLALDLRSPLVSLQSVSHVVAQDYGTQLPPGAQQLFQLIHANAQEMEELTQGLLRLMRVTRQTLRKQELYPEEIVRAAWADLQTEGRAPQVEMTVDHLPTCHADPLLLKQVWANLLSNALQATRRREYARIEIGAHLEGNRTVYFVRDNGVGFDMAYAGIIFRAFQRYHRPEDWDGSGVGLAIVERIIRRHGGRVWAEGVVNEGATFYFEV
jgi:signal transduction histidine kinase